MAKIIVVRRFDPPLTQAELRGVENRMAPCLDLYKVRWLRSYWSQDRRRMVCEYEAADMQSVREVQREAGARFEDMWLADVLEPTADGLPDQRPSPG